MYRQPSSNPLFLHTGSFIPLICVAQHQFPTFALTMFAGHFTFGVNTPAELLNQLAKLGQGGDHTRESNPPIGFKVNFALRVYTRAEIEHITRIFGPIKGHLDRSQKIFGSPPKSHKR